MLGVNHSVRNTPVSSRMMKLHSAISPSMNDQWSGKTLRTCFFMAVARPVRSSRYDAAAPTGLGLLAFAGLVALVSAILLVSMLMRAPSRRYLDGWRAQGACIARRRSEAVLVRPASDGN